MNFKVILRYSLFAVLCSVIGLSTFVAYVLDVFTDTAGVSQAERQARMQAAPNFDGSTFWNTGTVKRKPSLNDTLAILRRAIFGKQIRVPTGNVPVIPLSGDAFADPPPDGLRTTWLGHSTTLLEIDGTRILTDPVWSKRASPVQFMGPERFYEPPLAIEDLPALDAVIISHDHYDHLDKATVRVLASSGVKFFVPLGVGAHLEKWGIAPDQITELYWWQEAVLDNGFRIISTPAQHFSGRGLTDRYATLWTSFALVGPKHRVFFSGDGGFFDGLAEIGDRFGPFDVTLIEIGSYSRNWANIHMGPENAVKAHQLLKGDLLVPIHWGTFSLATHAWFEPPTRFLTAARNANIAHAPLRPGEQVLPGTPNQLVQWWQADKDMAELADAIERPKTSTQPHF